MMELEFRCTKMATKCPDDLGPLLDFLSHHKSSEIIAIIGKTEGNGLGNDYSRGLAVTSYRNILYNYGYKDITLIMSGGTEGLICPHINIIHKRERPLIDAYDSPRLSVGVANTRILDCAEIGTLKQVELVAKAVHVAINKAAITDYNDVHFVQVKCPLVNGDMKSHKETQAASPLTATQSMAHSRGASALGVAVGLGELKLSDVPEHMICANFNIYSRFASVSAGNELQYCEVVLFGNSKNTSGTQYIKSFLMEDMLDLSEVKTFIQDLSIQGHNIVQVFAKADPIDAIRGNRTTMYSDADIQPTRHARSALGGVLAATFSDCMLYVSGGAEHQGPQGGGVVAIIVDTREALI